MAGQSRDLMISINKNRRIAAKKNIFQSFIKMKNVS